MKTRFMKKASFIALLLIVMMVVPVNTFAYERYVDSEGHTRRILTDSVYDEYDTEGEAEIFESTTSKEYIDNNSVDIVSRSVSASGDAVDLTVAVNTEIIKFDSKSNIAAAIYNNNGQMLGVSIVPLLPLVSSEKHMSVKLNSKVGSTYNVKIFLLKDTEKLSPLTQKYDMTYIDAGGEYAIETCNNLMVIAPKVKLKNAYISGNLIIAKSVEDGDVTLDNVTVDGNAEIFGGGINTVLFNNSTVRGTIVVHKDGGNIRIVVSGNSSVSLVLLESGSIVVTDGIAVIGRLEIGDLLDDGANVVLKGNFSIVVNNKKGIQINAEGNVGRLLLLQPTTVSGDADIRSVTTAENAESTVNGTHIDGGSKDYIMSELNGAMKEAMKYGDQGLIDSSVKVGAEVTDRVRYIKEYDEKADDKYEITISKKSDDNNYIKVENNIVTLNKLAGSSLGKAIVTLTFTNIEDRTDTASKDVIVIIAMSDYIKAKSPDSRFADGYPKAQMDVGNENVILKVKLKDNVASKLKPVDMYAIVYQWDFDEENSSEAVIHGHGGNDNDDESLNVISYPYLQITDNKEYTLKSNFYLTELGDLKIDFVLKSDSQTSEKPTTIAFNKDVMNEINYDSPRLMIAYMNKGRDKIVMHYDKQLDTYSIPDPSAFSVASLPKMKINKVEVVNAKKGYTRGEVILSISGIDKNLKDDDFIGLNIKYEPTGTNDLQDLARTPNKCKKDSTIICPSTISVNVDKTYISIDKEYITLSTNMTYDHLATEDDYDITVRYGSSYAESKKVDYNKLDYIYSSTGTECEYFLKLSNKNRTDLSGNGNFFFELEPTPYMVDNAGDKVNRVVCTTPIKPSIEKLTPEYATYNLNYKEIELKMLGNIHEMDFSVCCFTLSVNGKDYVLRGYVHPYNKISKVYIDKSCIPVKINKTDTLVLKYKKIHESSYDQLADASGRSADSFEIPVEIVADTE